jgi:hypothetical protein
MIHASTLCIVWCQGRASIAEPCIVLVPRLATGKQFYLYSLLLVTFSNSDRMRFHVNSNMVAALNRIENEVCRVQQEVKKQKLTLIDMLKK